MAPDGAHAATPAPAPPRCNGRNTRTRSTAAHLPACSGERAEARPRGAPARQHAETAGRGGARFEAGGGRAPLWPRSSAASSRASPCGAAPRSSPSSSVRGCEPSRGAGRRDRGEKRADGRTAPLLRPTWPPGEREGRPPLYTRLPALCVQPMASTASCTSGASTPPRLSPASRSTGLPCSSPPTPS